MVAVAVNIF